MYSYKQHLSQTPAASTYVNRDEAVWQSNMFVNTQVYTLTSNFETPAKTMQYNEQIIT